MPASTAQLTLQPRDAEASGAAANVDSQAQGSEARAGGSLRDGEEEGAGAAEEQLPTYPSLRSQEDYRDMLRSWGDLLDKDDTQGVLSLLAQKLQHTERPSTEDIMEEYQKVRAHTHTPTPTRCISWVFLR